MKHYIVKDYSYFADIKLHVGTSAEINKLSKKLHPEGSLGFKARLLIPDDDDEHPLWHIMLKLDEKLTIWDEACLGHEVYHLASYVLESRGIPHNMDTEEAYAYYFQTMFAAMLHKVL